MTAGTASVCHVDPLCCSGVAVNWCYIQQDCTSLPVLKRMP